MINFIYNAPVPVLRMSTKHSAALHQCGQLLWSVAFALRVKVATCSALTDRHFWVELGPCFVLSMSAAAWSLAVFESLFVELLARLHDIFGNVLCIYLSGVHMLCFEQYQVHDKYLVLLFLPSFRVMLAPTATSSSFTKNPEGAWSKMWRCSPLPLGVIGDAYCFQVCQHVVHTACFCSGVLCTAYAEIKIPSVENTELTNVLLLKSGLGQNIATHASPTTRNFLLVLISAIPVRWPSFFPSPLLLNPTHLFIHVDPWNKTSRPVHSHKRFKQVPVVCAFRI